MRSRALSALFALLAVVCATITYICAAIIDFDRWAIYGLPLAVVNYLVIRWIARQRKPRNGVSDVRRIDRKPVDRQTVADVTRLSGKLAAKGRR